MRDWQLALVLWGTKYPVAELNHVIETARAHTATPPRVVLFTDRKRDGLVADVRQVRMDPFWLNPAFTGGGCQAKLCLFEPGGLEPDLPTIYVDLDTAVFGDLARLLDLQTTPETIAMLQSALLPFGALGRLAHRLSAGRRYARGNSSIVVFTPRHGAHIATRFRALWAEHGAVAIKPMRADERFISWAAQPQMRAIPRRFAVKLPTEFMLPWAWAIRARARLPWVRARWAGLLAVTLPGFEVKGAELLALAEGAEVIDRKGRRLIWSDEALGVVRGKLIDNYRALAAQLEGDR